MKKLLSELLIDNAIGMNQNEFIDAFMIAV